MLFTDIHESHYLRFARLYSFLIIRMLTNHTFVLTTPSWNITLLDKYYQMSLGLSTGFASFLLLKMLTVFIFQMLTNSWSMKFPFFISSMITF